MKLSDGKCMGVKLLRLDRHWIVWEREGGNSLPIISYNHLPPIAEDMKVEIYCDEAKAPHLLLHLLYFTQHMVEVLESFRLVTARTVSGSFIICGGFEPPCFLSLWQVVPNSTSLEVSSWTLSIPLLRT